MPRKPTEAEPTPDGDELDAQNNAFIEQQGRFHSEKDRIIAGAIARQLHNSFRENQITIDGYAQASLALQALIPVDNGLGKRQIDGKTIPPAAEQKITSRLQGAEVDIAGPEGSWGSLPESVKSHAIGWGSSITLELTTHCTVGCSFCSFANRGPVAAKASFDSTVAVIHDIMERQSAYHHPAPLSDSLYWGTDPFDIKWAATDTSPERDYFDIAKEHTRLAFGKERGLYTSTAVPLGEELRVLQFFNTTLSYSYNNRFDEIRLSKTRVNARRVQHLQTILGALHPQSTSKLKVNEVYDHIALRGSQWETASRDVNLWDITGPNCRDGVIIGVNSVDSVMMQGGSHQRPSGEVRTPIRKRVGNIDTYTLPHFNFKSKLDGSARLSAIYPDVEYSVIQISPDGQQTRETYKMEGDPHRALLRLAGAAVHYISPIQQARGKETIVEEFGNFFGQDVELIRKYLESGANNQVMAGFLRMLGRDGYVQ